LKPVVSLYGKTLAAKFSPLCLRHVRDEMIRLKWVRTSINRHIIRIRKMFKWALSVEALTNPDVLEMLRSVDGLQKNRSEAKESTPVRAVKRASVDAVEPHIKPILWSMISLQLVTGMRPGEVRLMTLGEVDRSDEVWEYRPAEHKLEHKDIERVIYIGSEGQKILLPYLKADPAQYLFEARPGKPYTKDSYCRAVTRACKRAKIDSWSPNQLRHTAATDIRKRFGLEASRVILGHSSADTTLVYAERDHEAAKAVIRQIG
jgi:integrase